MQYASIRHVSHPAGAGGMTLIETLVAVAVIVVAFVGFYDIFRASVDYVQNAAAREGALSLATERMESLRAMQYDSIGTVAGIPSGTIPQNEAIIQDGITYNRRTLVQYVDDSADGVGVNDTNGITTDYKRAKVDVSWAGPRGTDDVSLTSNFIPQGIESNSGGGTLSFSVIDAQDQPLSGAAIHITNASNGIDVTTYSDNGGLSSFPGTPQGSGYHIVVSKAGYSAAQTYPVSGTNTNPNPGDLTVSNGQTTSQTFAIDRLASLSVHTWQPIMPATTTDLLNDGSKIASFSNTAVSGGQLQLTLADSNGNYVAAGSADTAPIAPSYLSRWTALSWHSSTPAQTSLLLHLYQLQGGSYALIPDTILPGNAAGFSTSPVMLSAISTSTYPALVVGAALSTSFSSSTPALLDWSLSYMQGPTPLPSIAFTLQGAKTIGTNGSGSPVYKTLEALSTDASASYSTTTLEWDSYTTAVAATTGWDVSSYCPVQPLAVAPASSVGANLYLVAHTQNSFMVSAVDVTTGAPISGASASLSRTGYAGVETTDRCGNAFFSGLTAASDYSLTVSAPGYTNVTLSPVDISGRAQVTVSM